MLTSNFYNIFGFLLFLGILKRSLTHSGFTLFLTIFLGSCLSFCFFESPFVFLPIPLYFTQSFFQSLFAYLKAFFTNSFSLGKNQTEEIQVLPMTEKGKEKEKEKETNLVSTESSSLEEKLEKQNRSVIKTKGGYWVCVPESAIDSTQHVLSNTNAIYTMATAIADMGTTVYAMSIVKQHLIRTADHLEKFGDSAAKRRYASRNAVLLTALLILVVHRHTITNAGTSKTNNGDQPNFFDTIELHQRCNPGK